MKRLTGIISLFFCALLMSCSNGISDKTGDINFSFNAADFIRGSLEGDTSGISEYTFLVQVKGSRNYYDYQIQTVRVENNNADMDGGQQINPFPGGNAVFGVYDSYGDYIQNNELSFTFGYVPANQKYTVMLDMFAKQDDKNYLVLTGKSRDVEVKRGQPATVELDMENFPNNSMSPLYINVEYEGGNFDPISNYHLPPDGTSTIEGGTVFKKYGKLWYKKVDNSEPNPIKSIGFALDPNSNFPESSYKYSIPYGFPNEIGTVENPSWKEFSFDGDTYSLEDFLLNYRDFPAGYAFGEVEGDLKFGSFTSGYPAKISKGNFSFIECAPVFNFKSEDEVVSGHAESDFPFSRYEYDDGNTNNGTEVAYAFHDDDFLRNLLPENFDLEDEMSVVLVLTMKGSNPLPKSKQLYYKQYFEFLDNDPGSFFSDQCINHVPGETRFVIPLNSINPGENDSLLLAIKGDASTPQDDLTFPFDIDWYVFPNDMGAYIFKVSQPEGDSQYRYQMDKFTEQLLVDGCSPSSKLNGEVCFFNLTSKAFVPAKATLNSELYYFDNQDIFQAVPETQKQINTGVVSFDGGTTYYYLEYDQQNGWGDYAPYCWFSCFMPCNDRNILLIIRNCSYRFSSGQA